MALTFLTNSLYTVFLTTSYFTTLLRLLKLAGIVSNLSISTLSISGFKLAKSTILTSFDVITPATPLIQNMLHD